MRLTTPLLLAALLSTAAPLARAQTTAAPAAPATTPPLIHTAEDLLYALEKGDASIRTFNAAIQYTKIQKLEGDTQTRSGRIYFKQDPTPDATGKKPRAFAVHFQSLITGDRKQDAPEIYIFDGRWYVEKRPAEKRFTKREVARPGESFDPLKVGEGPMPIPIGQKAADITAKYAAELLESADGLDDDQLKQLPRINDWWQLRLTPHTVALAPGQPRPREEFKEIRLWYQKDTLLPRMARTTARGGDESFVVLLNPETNSPLPDGAIDSSEPPAGSGWETQIETLPPAGAQPAPRNEPPPK